MVGEGTAVCLSIMGLRYLKTNTKE